MEIQAAGTAGPCVAVDYLEKGEDLDKVRDGIGMMFSGGLSGLCLRIQS